MLFCVMKTKKRAYNPLGKKVKNDKYFIMPCLFFPKGVILNK
jgi:hypothetical protein